MKVAVIDMGSLKVKFLLAEKERDSFRIVNKKSKLTLLGDSLKEEIPKISDKSYKNSLNFIKELLEICKTENCTEIKIIATESFRKASNILEIKQRFLADTGLTFEIITPNRESDLLFSSIKKQLPFRQKFILVDNGGGSVQYIFSKGNGDYQSYSLPLGSYLLVQKFIPDDSENIIPKQKDIKKGINYINKQLSNLNISNDFLNAPIIYGTSSILSLIQFLKLDKFKSGFKSPFEFGVKPSTLINFLENLKGLSFKEREEKYQFQYGFMWGIDFSFYNVINLAKIIDSEVIIPTDINTSYAIIEEMINNR